MSDTYYFEGTTPVARNDDNQRAIERAAETRRRANDQRGDIAAFEERMEAVKKQIQRRTFSSR